LLHLRRRFNTSKKSHYDVLEVSATATQAQIKAAYYRLSMAHHPDQSKGDPDKFRVLTEAYETLKDVRKRNLYDKGFYGNSIGKSVSPEEAKESIHKMRNASKRSKGAVSTGRVAGVYDFDTWAQAHYSGHAFDRVEAKRRRDVTNKILEDEVAGTENASAAVSLLLVVVVGFVAWELFAPNMDRPPDTQPDR